jgi:hypothetical protein
MASNARAREPHAPRPPVPPSADRYVWTPFELNGEFDRNWWDSPPYSIADVYRIANCLCLCAQPAECKRPLRTNEAEIATEVSPSESRVNASKASPCQWPKEERHTGQDNELIEPCNDLGPTPAV